MTEPHHIRQARSGYKREFTFGSEKLTCKLRDPSGEREFSVPYEAIDVSSPSTLTLYKTPLVGWLFLLGVLCCIGAATAGGAGLPDLVSTSLFAFGMLLFGVALANRWTGWFSAKFTVLRISPPPPGTNAALMIINDQKHDEVMETLRGKWKERLKTLYGRANPNADHTQESTRLAWLRDRGTGASRVRPASGQPCPP